MQTVILCGGKATRLYPLTKTIAKSMIKIAGKPFLEHQLALLRKNKIFDIVLCVGIFGEQIKKHFKDGCGFGVNIKYSWETKPLGTGGAIKGALPLLNNSFFTMYGDSYLLFDYRDAEIYFKNSSLPGMMTVYRNENTYEPSNVSIKNNLVIEYDKKNHKNSFSYIDYGINAFKKSLFKNYKKDVFDLSEIHQKLIREKRLLAYEAKHRFYQIGNPSGLQEFKDMLKNNLS
jgi:NDP-sugar pyrophosphorylase family protein